MLDGYKLDSWIPCNRGGVLSNANSLLSEFNEHIDIKESYVGLIKENGYEFSIRFKIDKVKIAPKI